tara:strand:+ start:358 stop:669 length:312 start_codon:yes stop_codon:yes gene_type:complete
MKQIKENYELYCRTSEKPISSLIEEVALGLADWIANHNIPEDDVERTAFFAAVGTQVVEEISEQLQVYSKTFYAANAMSSSQEELTPAEELAIWNKRRKNLIH